MRLSLVPKSFFMLCIEYDRPERSAIGMTVAAIATTTAALGAILDQ